MEVRILLGILPGRDRVEARFQSHKPQRENDERGAGSFMPIDSEGNEDMEGAGEQALGGQDEADSIVAQASSSARGPVATGGMEEVDAPRAARSPATPSQAEIDEHELTHCVYSSWGDACVRAQAHDSPSIKVVG